MNYDHLFGAYGPNFKGTRKEFNQRCAKKEKELGRELTKAEVIVLTQKVPKEQQAMKTFDSGATRDSDDDKLDYDGFLSPLVIRRYAEYLHEHRIQADGKKRDSDNWQKGIPFVTYIKGLFRHFVDLWTLHRGIPVKDRKDGHDIFKEEACCAVIFNASGYLHELLKDTDYPQEERPFHNCVLTEGQPK